MTEPTSSGGASAPRWKRRGRTALLALVGLLTLATAAGSAYAMRLLVRANDALQHDATVQVDPEPDEPEKPVNVLILGSDTREGLTPQEQASIGTEEDVDGERSDTIIFAHFDPRRDHAVLVHFPRDLRVDIPGHGLDKINAAYSLGGPDLTLRTVRELTGLPIHHYVEVNFIGFREIVEALGGVEICVDRPMRDTLAGLNLPRAGCYDMKGDMALAFVRARSVEGDLIPDFARIARQQQFIRAVANKVLAFTSIPKLQDVVNAVAENVITDTDVSFTDLLDWAGELRGLAEADESGESSVDLRVVPSVCCPMSDGISYVDLKQPDADELFERIRNREPLGDIGTVISEETDLSPAQVTVQVLDGGGTENRIAKVDEWLQNAGFHVLEVGAAPRPKSQIVYGPGLKAAADVVAGYFPGLAVAQVPAEALGEAQVAVIVGRDFVWFDAIGVDPETGASG